MRAAVFRHGSAAGNEARGLDAGHGSGGLQDKGLRLDTFGLFRKRGIFQQLRKATCRANPHRKGVKRIGAWRAYWREVIARGLLAEVKDQLARKASTRTAHGRPVHRMFHLSAGPNSWANWPPGYHCLDSAVECFPVDGHQVGHRRHCLVDGGRVMCGGYHK